MRAEPDGDAEQVTQALAGEPLTVEEIRGEWALGPDGVRLPGLDPDDGARDRSGV